MGFGDGQGRLMARQQPMKMAAAEGIYHSGKGQALSVLAVGSVKGNPGHLALNIGIPHLESLITDLSWDGSIPGMDNIQAAERKQYGPGNYIPIVGVEYWSFRLMIGAGVLMMLIGLVGLVLMARRKLEVSRRFFKFSLLGIVLPILANWCGWVFTEVGRQPWVVFGLLKTSQARSPNVSILDIGLTLTGYVVIYGILIAIGGFLMLREARHGPEPDPVRGADGAGVPPAVPGHGDLVLAY
jgi:cytochrome d ubiquinol oxidase subunit I